MGDKVPHDAERETPQRREIAALDALERKLLRQVYFGLGVLALATLAGPWIAMPVFIVGLTVVVPTWQRWSDACDDYHRRYPF